MTDKQSELAIKEELELKRTIMGIDWLIFHGSVKVQIRFGKPSLITIERTVKLD